jgi:HK97 family phage major capsid protein
VISIADWMTQEMAWGFAQLEDDALFNGDGTSSYGGIHGVNVKIIDGNHGAGAVDAASGIDTFAEITATDLATAMAALPAYALPNAKWFVSQPGYALSLERLLAAGGGNTIATIEAGASRRQYLGYEVVVSQKMPTSTGDLSDEVMLLFGDLRMAAILGSRGDVRMRVSEERYMEYDQLGILGIERFDINVHSLGDGTTAGPIVALVGE